MLAADADLERRVGVRPRSIAMAMCAYALLVDRYERVDVVDALTLIRGQECWSIVAADPIGRLGEIVCTEGEEVDMARDVGGTRTARGNSIIVPKAKRP